MKGIIDITARLMRAGQSAYARKWSFLSLFALAFLGSVVSLAKLDLLPEATPEAAAAAEVPAPNVSLDATPLKASEPEVPVRIEIEKIHLSATVANPTSTVTEVLDANLLAGAVRYPTSAKLGETGNVVLFGHSSYLPIVNNPAYKTFNDIQKLAKGDLIAVYSADAVYTYRVRSVAKESANDAGIALEATGRVLTLATCNSFGAKTDRFVVTADFVESHPAGS